MLSENKTHHKSSVLAQQVSKCVACLMVENQRVITFSSIQLSTFEGKDPLASSIDKIKHPASTREICPRQIDAWSDTSLARVRGNG